MLIDLAIVGTDLHVFSHDSGHQTELDGREPSIRLTLRTFHEQYYRDRVHVRFHRR